jgi:hypothetical protein
VVVVPMVGSGRVVDFQCACDMSFDALAPVYRAMEWLLEVGQARQNEPGPTGRSKIAQGKALGINGQ